MKQLIAIIGIILMSCVIISAVIIPANADSSNAYQIAQAFDEQDNVYVIKENNGSLSVYLEGESEPIITTETNVSVLPKNDQKELEQGVRVKGEKALQKALEDYCS